jgi:hypothetical protein
VEKGPTKQPAKGSGKKSQQNNLPREVQTRAQQNNQRRRRRPLSKAKESLQSDLQLPQKAKNERESVEKTLVCNIA